QLRTARLLPSLKFLTACVLPSSQRASSAGVSLCIDSVLLEILSNLCLLLTTFAVRRYGGELQRSHIYEILTRPNDMAGDGRRAFGNRCKRLCQTHQGHRSQLRSDIEDQGECAAA